MKIKAQPEGRDGIYIPDRESLIEWIRAQHFEDIHNLITGGIMLGADHSPESVIADIQKADRLAITTGKHWRENMRHALALIFGRKLELYDIGEITPDMIESC